MTSSNDMHLELNRGVELRPTSDDKIRRAVIIDAEGRYNLTWDRFLRLHNAAREIRQRAKPGASILDVGGFDGALALFIPDWQVDVIDPVTTGGSAFDVAGTYDVVVSIDALEHVNPEERPKFIEVLGAAAHEHIFINFPGAQSIAAQKIVFELTNNPLVGEHVQWALPDVTDVAATLKQLGFQVEQRKHTSRSQWVSQYVLQTVAAAAAATANRYLLENHLEDEVSSHLYELVIGKRISSIL